MVTTVYKSNTVAFPIRKRSTRHNSYTVSQHAELRLQLSDMLQTTLELPQVLQLFFDEIKQSLNINSLNFRNEKLESDIELGKSARHNCHYKLVTNQDALGEIAFSRNKRFTETELQLLEVLISCLICPVRNALMYREALQSALRDPLTGTGNRLAMENTLRRELALALRHQTPLSILIVDIDKFKNINDRYGHSAGDCVLKDVSRMLTQSSRDTDSAYRAYRFGGEEFVLLLNNTDNEGAMIVSERIRQSIEDISTTFEENSLNVTVSIGVSTLHNEDSVSSLFARADKALYKAKDKGRNQVFNSQEQGSQSTADKTMLT